MALTLLGLVASLAAATAVREEGIMRLWPATDLLVAAFGVLGLAHCGAAIGHALTRPADRLPAPCRCRSRRRRFRGR